MLKRRLATLLGVVAIPLGPSPQWHHFQYKSLKANGVSQRPEALTLHVEDSASPLFYRLPEVTVITGFRLRGNFRGTLKPSPAGKDDFPLRLGLVIPGNERLGWLARLFAPLWIKQLHEMEPEMAVKSVHFFVLSDRDMGVKSRARNDLITEEFVQVVKEGPFQVDYPVSPAMPAFAVWVQADGDDSHSSFTTRIDELILKTEEVSP